MPAESLAYAAADQTSARFANDCARSEPGQTAGAVPAMRIVASEESAGDELAALRALPETATLRDVVAAVLGERPTGHGQTYANVVLTQRALARLVEAASGRAVAPWEAAP
jgi:hypothetical protein